MRLLVKVNGKPTIIVGYGPGEGGVPKAIVVLDNRLHAVALSDIELPKLPKRLRKALSHKAQASGPKLVAKP